MALKALLTVDLENGVSADQRQKFNEKMAELKWLKVSTLTTTWTSSFVDGVTITKAFEETQSDVYKSATVARILNYHCAVQFGTDNPSLFKNQ